jgi:hypothetical protein
MTELSTLTEMNENLDYEQKKELINVLVRYLGNMTKPGECNLDTDKHIAGNCTSVPFAMRAAVRQHIRQVPKCHIFTHKQNKQTK